MVGDETEGKGRLEQLQAKGSDVDERIGAAFLFSFLHFWS
jgi:hypothetical protein